MRKKNEFDPMEVIRLAQTEIICGLLRLIPRKQTVRINKMFRFLNTDSGLGDGFVVDSVRLVEDGHYVEMTYREPDYETLDLTIHDITDIDEKHGQQYLLEPQTVILKERPGDTDQIRLLAMIYTEAMNRLKNGESVPDEVK